jgi:rod shape-determining protein MreC
MLGATITGPLTGLGNVARNLTADEKTLSDLMEENARLSARNVELEEAALTAQRLQELLDLKSTYNLQATAARVIAGSTDSWTATVTIDKGTNAGIAVGMPVVDQYGAVGQVISCAGTTSTVRLLSDEGSSVSAMVQSSRAQGMLEGSIDGTLHLEYIRTDQTVNVGDIVVTSGLGGVFPKGLPLGTVISVERTSGALYYDIEVEPLSSTESFEEVLVITSLTEDQKPTAEEVAQADQQDSSSNNAKGNVSGDSGEADADATDETADEEVVDGETEDEIQDEG